MLNNKQFKKFRSFINNLGTKQIFDIKELPKLISYLETLIREKESNLLSKRKEIILKFNKNIPKFKKEIIQTIILTLVFYISILFLNIFYGISIRPEDIEPKDILLILPEDLPERYRCEVLFTYELPKLQFISSYIAVPWMYEDILDV